jgi:hypothetical protein
VGHGQPNNLHKDRFRAPSQRVDFSGPEQRKRDENFHRQLVPGANDPARSGHPRGGPKSEQEKNRRGRREQQPHRLRHHHEGNLLPGNERASGRLEHRPGGGPRLQRQRHALLENRQLPALVAENERLGRRLQGLQALHLQPKHHVHARRQPDAQFAQIHREKGLQKRLQGRHHRQHGPGLQTARRRGPAKLGLRGRQEVLPKDQGHLLHRAHH